jgi:hypothetical protein
MRTKPFLGIALFISARALAADMGIGVGLEYLQWREYHPLPLLEETGFRPFLRVDARSPLSAEVDAELGGRIYGGEVDYNGQRMDGTPLKATTGYAGAAAEGGGRWRVHGNPGAERLSVIFHGGVEQWDRDLKGAFGYRERYRLFYTRFGVEDEAPAGGWSARGGLLLPFAVREEVNLAGGFTLEPKGRPSLYVEFGRRLGAGWEAGIGFRRYRFDGSNAVLVDVDGDGNRERVFQPASDQDVYDIYARLGF